jgi:hypothetical protein
MNLHEKYLGIKFSISDNGDGTCAWALHPPDKAMRPVDGAGSVPGGQNEAILAARKAIGMYVGVLAAKPIKTRAKTGR